MGKLSLLAVIALAIVGLGTAPRLTTDVLAGFGGTSISTYG